MRAGTDILPVYTIDTLPGAAPQQSELMAERFASYLEVHPNLHAAHGHSFYHLVLFTKGGGFHTVDFRRFPVRKGALYFMVPGQVHSWAFEGKTDGYVVNFNEGFFQSLLADNAYLERFRFFSGDINDQIFQLKPAAFSSASALLERAVAELQERAPMYLDSVRLILLEFFILITRETATKAHEPSALQGQALTLQNFRRLLNLHFRELRLPRDYAALLYVTPNYLNALCQDLLQKPAGELIRERVLLEAKRLLVNQHQDVAGIAYALGFKDNSYFSRFFRKYTGLTPEAFRKQELKGQVDRSRII
jgi:AraC family transcriptional activator of pobA